jgi:hypothetical protein
VFPAAARAAISTRLAAKALSARVIAGGEDHESLGNR